MRRSSSSRSVIFFDIRGKQLYYIRATCITIFTPWQVLCYFKTKTKQVTRFCCPHNAIQVQPMRELFQRRSKMILDKKNVARDAQTALAASYATFEDCCLHHRRDVNRSCNHDLNALCVLAKPRQLWLLRTQLL